MTEWIPQIQEVAPELTQQPQKPGITKKNKQDAFYAASSAPDTEKEKVYDEALNEFQNQGYSEFVQQKQDNWKKEQEANSTAYVKEKLLDPNVSPEEKKAYLELYESGQMVDPNLRTQFFENAVSKDLGNTVADTQSQEALASAPLKLEMAHEKIAPGSPKDLEYAEAQKTFLQKWKDAGVKVVDVGIEYLKYMKENPREGAGALWDVARTLGSGLAHSLAAGYAGLWTVSTENAEQADELIKQIMEAMYKGDGEAYEKAMGVLNSIGEFIDVPFQSLADEAYEATGSPLVGALVYAVPQAFGYVAGGAVGIKATIKTGDYILGAKEGIKAAVPWGGVKVTKENEEILNESKKAHYKKQAAKELGVRTEPVFHDIDLIDPDTPASVVGQANPLAATHIGASAVTDSTGKLADSMGTTRAELLNTWMLDKLDPELERLYPDIYNSLVRKDLEAEQMYKDAEVDPYLFDPAKINNSIDKYVSFITENTEVHMNLPNSWMETSGNLMRGKIRFTRNEGYGWMDDHDAVIAVIKLNRSLEEAGLGGRKKELNQEGYTYSRVTIEKNEFTGENVLVWEFNKKIDKENDLFFGTLADEAKFGPWNIGGFANTTIGKWILNPAARLPLWVTQGMSRADIRASRPEKYYANILRDHVLKSGVGKEISQAIHLGEEQGKFLSVNELQEMFLHKSDANVEKIIEGYMHYRRLTEYMYNITNRSVRDHYIKSGQHGLYVGDEFVGVGKAVDVETIDPLELPAVVWDPVHQAPIKYQAGTGTLAKLNRPLHKDGNSYDYVVVTDAAGPLPPRLIPKVDGYFPHINKEPYYISMRNKTVFANGKEVTDPHELSQYDETIAIAKTEKEALALAAKLQEENPEAIVWARAERYDDINETLTNMDIAKFNLDVTKSRRKERLRYADGTVGRIEDPAVALYKRMQQVNRLDAWKDIDLEFRRRFIESYSQFLTDNQFPSDQFPMRPPVNPSLESGRQSAQATQKMWESAVALLDHYKTQQHVQSMSDKLHKAFFINIAKPLERVPAVADFLRDFAHKSTVFGLVTKLTTMKYIHLNPYRQWLLQPAQVTELVPMAIATGNRAFLKAANAQAHPLFKAILAESDSAPAWLKEFMKVDRHKDTGMTEAEFTELVDAFKKVGIPTGIDLNSILHGVFREAGRGLDETGMEKLGHGLKKTGMFIPNFSKTVGFSGAELLNNVFLFLYAKGDFETRFPGKKWNDPHNLEMIASKALSVGNTMMGRGDQMPYQHGALRAVMQFMTYPHKAILQPFTSKALTTQEKVSMFLARTILFGTNRASGAALFNAYLEAALPKDVALPGDIEKGEDPYDRNLIKEVLTDGLINTMFNTFHQSFFDQGPGKTSLDLAKSINPLGDTGIPYGDFFVGMWKWANGEKQFSRTMPFLSGLSTITDTYNYLHTIFTYKDLSEMSPEEIGKVVTTIGSWASGMSNYEKALAMKKYEDYLGSTGQQRGHILTQSEAFWKALGVQSKKEQAIFDIYNLGKDRDKHIKDSAKRVMEALHSIESTFDNPQAFKDMSIDELAAHRNQLYNRVGFLISLYSEPGVRNEMFEEVVKLDAQRMVEGLPSIMARIMNRKAAELDDYQQRQLEILNKLRDVDPNVAKVYERMTYDIRNYMKEDDQ